MLITFLNKPELIFFLSKIVSNIFLSNMNNSIHYQSIDCTQLTDQKVLFPTIQLIGLVWFYGISTILFICLSFMAYEPLYVI